MNVDKTYWENEFEPPLGPSLEDVDFFKSNLMEGTTLLLGCTKKLIPISDFQMDIDPWYKAKTMIIQDWTTNQTFYNNIIGDGVFNFTEDLSKNILDMASKNCNILTIRCFNHKLPIMRIAANFPSEENFHIRPAIVKKLEDYSFYVWKF